MADEPYVGEIRLFAGDFAPIGWALCHGQLLSIPQYESLFGLIGTTYGGDGFSTFAVPDLRGRVPLHQGNGFILGQQWGRVEEALAVTQIPSHRHALMASSQLATAGSPASNAPAATSGTAKVYSFFEQDNQLAPMAADAVSTTGGNQPHTNLMPYLGLTFIISLAGVFPPPS